MSTRDIGDYRCECPGQPRLESRASHDRVNDLKTGRDAQQGGDDGIDTLLEKEFRFHASHASHHGELQPAGGTDRKSPPEHMQVGPTGIAAVWVTRVLGYDPDSGGPV